MQLALRGYALDIVRCNVLLRYAMYIRTVQIAFAKAFCNSLQLLFFHDNFQNVALIRLSIRDILNSYSFSSLFAVLYVCYIKICQFGNFKKIDKLRSTIIIIYIMSSIAFWYSTFNTIDNIVKSPRNVCMHSLR